MVYRKRSEIDLPELQGYSAYTKQAPASRCIPLWGGIGPGGFAPVLWHDERKTNTEEYVEALREGSLMAALRHCNPRKRSGPWGVLCDNEAFLRAGPCCTYYSRHNITLWNLPAKSPDLNPIEKMWGWMRKRLRAMDLADLKAGRPVPGRTAYRERVKRLLRSQKAQTVARNFYSNIRTVAKRVKKAKGGAVRG